MFLHPSSTLHKAAPEWIVYSQLVQTDKRIYMSGEQVPRIEGVEAHSCSASIFAAVKALHIRLSVSVCMAQPCAESEPSTLPHGTKCTLSKPLTHWTISGVTSIKATWLAGCECPLRRVSAPLDEPAPCYQRRTDQ